MPAPPIYLATVVLGAFLLFLVQPIMGKFILPWFGGGSSVWTTCLLFFQTVLLAGYAYAHALTSKLRPRAQCVAHLAALGLALVFLPIFPNEAWKPTPEQAPTLRILLLLGVTIGWPFFVLSATAPLLQRWFCWLEPGKSPYRLYAWSNGGSLAALFLYPFVIEPELTRPAQSALWSAGLLVFVGCCATIAWRLRGLSAVPEEDRNEGEGPAFVGAPVTRVNRLFWIALSTMGSALLLASTNKICQDAASTPLLWVLPLCLYLVSFIIVFHDPKSYQRVIYVSGFFISLMAVAAAIYLRNYMTLSLQVWAYCFALFFGCMSFHGELSRLRPSTASLTSYYLAISIGGALGAFLVAIVAPVLLNHYYELQIVLIVGSILLLAVMLRDKDSRLNRGLYRANWAWLATALFVAALAYQQDASYSSRDVIHSSRNFYGALMVHEKGEGDPAAHRRVLQHGNIRHGSQFLSDELRSEPTTYYGRSSGGGLAFQALEKLPERRIGVIGLGVGTLAAFGREGDLIRFYEIDPNVVDAAENYFSYLKDSKARGATIEFVPGDARLSMENESRQAYDLIVVDAFSSDAIPTHLLTREAFELYRSHLKPGGVIALHLSNRNLMLPLVVWAVAYDLGLETALIDDIPAKEDRKAKGIGASTWMLVTSNKAYLEQDLIATNAVEVTVFPKQGPMWTDNYSALYPVLR